MTGIEQPCRVGTGYPVAIQLRWGWFGVVVANSGLVFGRVIRFKLIDYNYNHNQFKRNNLPDHVIHEYPQR